MGGVSCAGAYRGAEISDVCMVCLPATAGCCAAITVHECSDWLQHCLMNIHPELFDFISDVVPC